MTFICYNFTIVKHHLSIKQFEGVRVFFASPRKIMAASRLKVFDISS